MDRRSPYPCQHANMLTQAYPLPRTHLLETTPSRSPSAYATSKVTARCYTINHREAYGSFAANDILFNYESAVVARYFITKKITHAIGPGKASMIFLFSLEAPFS
ncbi:GDP-mannose 4 dehydratase 2 [Nymphaea thermarum]|nr:GDP-mannose 4 dehydratase 2 [Nymphaea thermarum]